MLKWSVTNHKMDCQEDCQDINTGDSQSGKASPDAWVDLSSVTDISDGDFPFLVAKSPRGKRSTCGFVTIGEDVLQYAGLERGFLPHLNPRAPPAFRTAVCKTLRRLNCLEACLAQCYSEATRRNVETEISVCRRRLRILDGLLINLKEENKKRYQEQFLTRRPTSYLEIRPKSYVKSVKHRKMSGHGRVLFLDSKGAARARKRADNYFGLPGQPQINPEDKVIICTNEGIKSTPQPSEIRVERPAQRASSGSLERPRNTVLISVGPSESGVQTRVNIHLVNPEHAAAPRITSGCEKSEYLSGVRSENSSRGIQRAQSYQGDLNSVGKLTRCASYGDSINLAGGLKQRAPSVEEILDNIRKMSKEKTVKDKKRKAPQPGSLLGIKYNNPKPEPIYSPVDVSSSPKLSDGVYQNVQESYYENMENWYDCPKSPSGEKTYANLVNEVESEYENINYGERLYSNTPAEYCNVETLKKRAKQKPSPMYDVPKSAIHIYDSPQKNVKYDKPKRSDERSGVGDCDSDSLESEAGVIEEPDIPPPDYGNVNEEYYDEGIGESDARSYYTEDQGLEVIPEEPEEEEEEERHFNLKHQRQDCIPMSADEVTRDCVRTAGSNTSLGSLGGSESEGIGSAAEGEFHSSGESTHGEENESKIELEKDLSPAYVENRETSTDEKTEADRCVEVYNETVRQRTSSKSPRTSICESPAKDYAGTDTLRRMRKFLPSVRALRNQFEVKKDEHSSGISDGSSTRSSSPSTKSRSRRSSMESNFSTSSVSSRRSTASTETCRTDESSESSRIQAKRDTEVASVESIIKQFANLNPEKILYRSASSNWDPTSLVNSLYSLPVPSQPSSKATNYINIEGYLEKLPSGRKKATFWNAWKKRYFRVEDGYLYYYQSSQNDKPSFKIQLMGGEVQIGENNMIGIDDGKGHYIAVRCSSEEDLEKWRIALLTQVQENFNAAWTYPSPLPLSPTLFKEVVILDLGSCSVRAGVLTSQATLPQLFYPAVVARNKSNETIAYGYDALKPQIRATSTLKYPFRTTTGVNKYAVDMPSLTGFLSLVFRQLNVDPSRYHIQLSLPRTLPPSAQVELLKVLFDQFGVRGVNLTHQSVLALGAYSASSGIVVDIGERMDIVPIMDGYMLDSGVSRVPYGGHEIAEHVRHFLLQKNYSLVSEAETFIVRLVLERLCYVSGPSSTAYHNELALAQKDPLSVQASLNLEQYRGEHVPWGEIVLESGRFQVPEGLFHPDAWGLDHPGVQKLVCRAIQECGVDIRKEMSRSIYLAGGVTMLPGFAERLQEEVNRLTPPGISPKVHASPYRYHAAYLGACVLANALAFEQLRITREDWHSLGPNSVRKWKV